MVPREESRLDSARPFDLKVSDADVLIEVKPEGKVCSSQAYVDFMLIVFRTKP